MLVAVFLLAMRANRYWPLMDNLNAIGDGILAPCLFSDEFAHALGVSAPDSKMAIPQSGAPGSGSDPLAPAQTQIFCRSALEWILQSIDPANAKIWAARLIDSFGSLANAMASDIEVIADLLEGDYKSALHLFRMHRIFMHVSKCEVRFQSVTRKWDQLIEYLKMDMGQLRVEHLRVMFLNERKILIGDEVLNVGTINEASCYPMQVARRAVVQNAAAIILVHNHPSGNAKINSVDKSVTFAVAGACRAVGVELYDHLVICRDEHSSFRIDNPLWARSA